MGLCHKYKRLYNGSITFLILKFLVNVFIYRNIIRSYVPLLFEKLRHISYFNHGKSLLQKYHQILFRFHLKFIEDDPLPWVGRTYILTEVVCPFLPVSPQITGNIDSNPTRNCSRINFFEVIWIKIYQESFCYFKAGRKDIEAIFWVEISRSGSKSDDLWSNIWISWRKMIGLHDSQQKGIVSPCWVWQVDIIVYFFHITNTSLL